VPYTHQLTPRGDEITELRGVNLRITEIRSTRVGIRQRGRWRVHIDGSNDVLGNIDPVMLGAKLPVFVPLPRVAEEGIGAEFLLEIATAMVIITAELQRRLGG
jgi:hypothetical protein